MSDFVHLHLHSEYSMLDGLVKFPDLINKLKEQNQTAVALTDHGNMHGAVEFHNLCRKNDINPILGCEVYVAANGLKNKQQRAGQDQFHLTILAQNFTGYQNLMKLVSIAHFQGYHYKPRIDEEALFKHSQGLIVLTGCFNGYIASLIHEKKIKLAKEKIALLKENFADRLYIEVQNHGLSDQKKLNTELIKLAREFEVKLVATNDVHYLNLDDAEAQDALLAVGTRTLISDKDRLSMIDTPEYYLKSAEQMESLFSEIPEAVENTLKIAEQCQVKIPTGQLIFPNFSLPKAETEDSYLRKLTTKGLKSKFKEITPKIKDRMEYELKIIHEKGYDTYFLVTHDFVKWAKDNKIGVGPGRGSVAGSIVSYGLDITTIDPFAHGLPFERFLNPQRPTPPDIDIDFADDRRDEVIQYVANKYGHDVVGHVITFGRMEARGAIRDIGRVLGLPYEDPDRVAKLIPNNPQKKTSIKQAIKTVPELSEYYKQDKFKKLLDLASRVEGTVRHSSVHAAAVVIADKPLQEYTPIQKDSKTEATVTQYDMYSLDCNVNDDAIGLIKFDFLGLRNLSTIQSAINLIKKHKKIEVDWNKVPINDKKTYELISSGETTGIFQLESAGMRRVARNLKPSQFSDITAMLALFRPGPMELIPQFIQGKHNPESVAYPHPSLKGVLEETYGIMVYQEQILEIAHIMAGYSLGEADILRRAIGKKKKKILDRNKKRFIRQAVKKGYQEKTAVKVWGFIEAFANYGFNKSHAASYGMISYQTAYLKANYPVEYMTALMSVESSSHSANTDEKIAIAIEASKNLGIKILPPDINKSGKDFTIEQHASSLNKQAIRFSLSAVKNIGTAAIENILSTREKHGEFVSFTQFIHLTDTRKVNKTVLESLIKVGAMDRFGTRASMLENFEEIRQTAASFETEQTGQDNLFADVAQDVTDIQDTFEQIPEYPKKELLSFEKELLGIYLTEHPLADSLKTINKLANKQIEDIDPNIHIDQSFLLGGVMSKIRHVKTRKRNQDMCFGVLEDQTGSIRFVIFPKTYEQYKHLIEEERVALVKGKINLREGELNFIVEKITTPQEQTINHNQEEDYQQIFIPRKTSKKTLEKLGKLLKSNPGKDQVMVVIPNGGSPRKIRLPYTVKYTPKLEKQIQELLN
jgi:DNA polymerase-3 subunit alpha